MGERADGQSRYRRDLHHHPGHDRTAGDIRISAVFGHPQLTTLSLETASGDDKTFRTIDIPATSDAGAPDDPAPGNVYRVYERMADDIENGTRTAPTFDTVGLHRVIAAIEDAANRQTSVDHA
jgi:hypothetical protein